MVATRAAPSKTWFHSEKGLFVAMTVEASASYRLEMTSYRRSAKWASYRR